MTTPEFEYIDHIADVGIRMHADSLEELFSTAARALVDWMGPPPPVMRRISFDVVLEAEDTAGLLVRWMQEVLYRFHVDHLYFTGVEFKSLGERKLDGRIEGCKWLDGDAGRYQEVKAVTYHQPAVRKTEGGWIAKVILDL